MAKYVIEIEDEPFGRNDDPVIPHGMDELYRAKGFKSLVFDKNGLDKLTPYTESDEDEIRRKAHEEAWEFASDICHNRGNILDILEFMTATAVFDTLYYSEAKAKYDAWKKQKDKIRVGDEVVDGQGIKCVVTSVDECHLHGFRSDNGGACYRQILSVTKTGRHFPEVAELLKKMREE